MLLTDTDLLASITTAHLAIAFLRRHRTPGGGAASPFVLPSFVIAFTPWLWPSPAGLAVVGAIHLVWLAVCEAIAPPLARPSARPVATSTRPATNTPRQTTRPTTAAAPAARARTGGFVSAPVLAVLDEATDIKTFRLARPEGLDFVAGQFVAVRVSVNGKPHVRCYSISSSPDARGYLEISVRRQGMVSTLLHATVRTGSQLAIAPPAGQFIYPRGDDRPLALMAGGIGITPLLSMLRYAVSSDPTRPVTLLYSARDRQSLAFVSELRVVAERYPQVRIGLTLSQDDSAPASWRRGHIDLAFLRQYVPHPTHTVFCICGPTPMMAAMERMLLGEGVPKDQIRSEAFATAAAAASLNATDARLETTGHGSSVELAAPISAEAEGSEYSITFAASARQGPLLASQTLLEAAEAEGISIPSSCRAGVCQACRTRLLEGEAECRSSMLDADDRSAGFILPCVTWASSDCVLEA